MAHPVRHRAHGARVAAVLLIVLAAAPASAAEPPYNRPTVALVAREQPIEAFLQTFFGELGLGVNVSRQVTGTVNGTFRGAPAAVYGEVSRAFDLATYYDGSSVYVYRSAELTSRTLNVPGLVAERVGRSVDDLRLADARNTLQRTGSLLIVTGAPRFVEQVEELVRAHGLSTMMSPPIEYRVFYLRYAWAEDVTFTSSGREVVVPGVANILRSLLNAGGAAQERVVGRTETVLPPTVPGLRELDRGRDGLVDGAPGGRDFARPVGPEPLDRPTATAPTPRGAMPDGISMPAREAPRVQADSRLNAVIVRDTPERMATYEGLIRALDMEPQLIEIEAAIIDINTSRLRELGINYRFDDGEGGFLLGRGEGSDAQLGARGTTPVGRGLFINSVIGNGDVLFTRINALETEGALKVVSRPQIVTLSNVEAAFDANRTFFVRVAGERDVDLFNITAGTALRVTPHVTTQGGRTRIRLLVSISDGSLQDGSVDSIPIVQRSSINTQAVIEEGQSLLVGGLTVQRDVDAVDKVPLLGDVPVLGRLFRSERKETGRIERLFLLTPRVAQQAGPAAGPRLDTSATAGPAIARPLAPVGLPRPLPGVAPPLTATPARPAPENRP